MRLKDVKAFIEQEGTPLQSVTPTILNTVLDGGDPMDSIVKSMKVSYVFDTEDEANDKLDEARQTGFLVGHKKKLKKDCCTLKVDFDYQE